MNIGKIHRRGFNWFPKVFGLAHSLFLLLRVTFQISFLPHHLACRRQNTGQFIRLMVDGYHHAVAAKCKGSALPQLSPLRRRNKSATVRFVLRVLHRVNIGCCNQNSNWGSFLKFGIYRSPSGTGVLHFPFRSWRTTKISA